MKLDRRFINLVLIVVLIVVIAINTCEHILNNTQRRMDDRLKVLEAANNDFQKEVVKLVVGYLGVVTNNQNSVSVSNQVGEIRADVNLTQTLFQNKDQFLSISSFVLGSRVGFRYEERDYFVGDLFFGSPIIAITPQMIKTFDGFFLCHNSYHKELSATNNSTLVVRQLPDVHKYSEVDYDNE